MQGGRDTTHRPPGVPRAAPARPEVPGAVPRRPDVPRAATARRRVAFPVILTMFLFALFPAGPLAGQESYEFLGRYVSRGELTVPPTRLGDLVLTASEDRRVYAIAPGGTLKWRAELGGRATTPVAVAPAGTLATVVNGRELLLLDADGGNEIWRWRFSAEISSITVAPEGILLLQTGQQRIRAVSLSGRELWSRELRDPFSTEPILGPGELLYLGEESGRLTAYDLSGGVQWTRLLEKPARGLAASGEELFLLEGERELRSFGVDGVPRLSVNLQADYARFGVGPGRELVLLRHGGGVELRDSQGDLRWSAPRAEDFAFTPEGVLLALPEARAELRSWRGRLLWELQSEGGVRNLTYLGESFLVAYGDWVLSWYRSPVGGEAYSGWGGPRGGPGRTGALPSRHTQAVEEEGAALFQELARSSREEDRRRLLRAVEDRLESGKVAGQYRSLREVTIRVALEPYRYPRSQGAALLNDYPDLRGRAATLLGRWGDLPSRNALLQLLGQERTPEVVLSALDALSRIPWDQEDATAVALLGLYNRWEDEPRSVAVTEAILSVMAGIETSQGDGAERLYREILLSRLPASLRQQARRLLSDHFENRE